MFQFLFSDNYSFYLPRLFLYLCNYIIRNLSLPWLSLYRPRRAAWELSIFSRIAIRFSNATLSMWKCQIMTASIRRYTLISFEISLVTSSIDRFSEFSSISICRAAKWPLGGEYYLCSTFSQAFLLDNFRNMPLKFRNWRFCRSLFAVVKSWYFLQRTGDSNTTHFYRTKWVALINKVDIYVLDWWYSYIQARDCVKDIISRLKNSARLGCWWKECHFVLSSLSPGDLGAFYCSPPANTYIANIYVSSMYIAILVFVYISWFRCTSWFIHINKTIFSLLLYLRGRCDGENATVVLCVFKKEVTVTLAREWVQNARTVLKEVWEKLSINYVSRLSDILLVTWWRRHCDSNS